MHSWCLRLNWVCWAPRPVFEVSSCLLGLCFSTRICKSADDGRRSWWFRGGSTANGCHSAGSRCAHLDRTAGMEWYGGFGSAECGVWRSTTRMEEFCCWPTGENVMAGVNVGSCWTQMSGMLRRGRPCCCCCAAGPGRCGRPCCWAAAPLPGLVGADAGKGFDI